MNFNDSPDLRLLDKPQNLDTEVDLGLSAEAAKKGSRNARKTRGLLIHQIPVGLEAQNFMVSSNA